MAIDGFDYKGFAENMYEQALGLIPNDFSDEDKRFVSDTMLKFSKIAGEALDEENEFNSEQAEFITQLIAEWTFHKSVDLIKSDIPREFWEPALRKIAMVIFEVCQNGIRQGIEYNKILATVEQYVDKTYNECVKELKNKDYIDETIFKQAMEQSNIEIMAQASKNISKDSNKQNIKFDNDILKEPKKPSGCGILISHVIIALILCFGTPFAIDKAWGIFGGNTKMILLLGFLIFCFVVLIFNRVLEKDINEQLKKIEEVRQNMKDLVNPDRFYLKLGVDILTLQVGNNLLKVADPDIDGQLLAKVAALRQTLTDDLGYIIPNIRIMDNLRLNDNEYCILIHDKKAANGIVHPFMIMVDSMPIELSDDKEIKEDINPLNGKKAYWISNKNENISGMIPEAVIVAHLKKIVIENADKVLSYKQTYKYIELVKGTCENLVKDVLKLLSVIDIKNILAGLIKENVSIKDIVLVFELLSDYARETKDINVLIEKLKSGLE